MAVNTPATRYCLVSLDCWQLDGVARGDAEPAGGDLAEADAAVAHTLPERSGVDRRFIKRPAVPIARSHACDQARRCPRRDRRPPARGHAPPVCGAVTTRTRNPISSRRADRAPIGGNQQCGGQSVRLLRAICSVPSSCMLCEPMAPLVPSVSSAADSANSRV